VAQEIFDKLSCAVFSNHNLKGHKSTALKLTPSEAMFLRNYISSVYHLNISIETAAGQGPGLSTLYGIDPLFKDAKPRIDHSFLFEWDSETGTDLRLRGNEITQKKYISSLISKPSFAHRSADENRELWENALRGEGTDRSLSLADGFTMQVHDALLQAECLNWHHYCTNQALQLPQAGKVENLFVFRYLYRQHILTPLKAGTPFDKNEIGHFASICRLASALNIPSLLKDLEAFFSKKYRAPSNRRSCSSHFPPFAWKRPTPTTFPF
jgi:hypothetical protein